MDIQKISLDQKAEAMPRWAELEREYFKLASNAPEMLADYLTEDGQIHWPESVEDFQTFAYGNVDNAFEGFQGFPLLYLLGGDKKLLDFARKEFLALHEQFAQKKKIGPGIPQDEAEKLGRDKLLVDGTFPNLDWMHIGESNMLMYHLLLANPEDEKVQEYLMKAAGYAFGENPAGFESNYDPEHKVFRSCYLGSNGPDWERFKQPIYHSHWMDYYGLAFYDVPGVVTYLDLAKKENAERYGKVYGERMAQCDTVTGMIATSLAVNAFMITQDPKYRQFVLDYVGAWRKRKEGQEFMPDNAGPHGEVGETLGGRFYGGHYGWTHPHGYYFIEDALIIGGENERFFTGDEKSLDWARDLYNSLIDRYGIPQEKGGVIFPHKRADDNSIIEYIGNENTPMTRPDKVVDFPTHVRYKQVDGWYEFGVPEASHWGHIYAASRSAEDARRIAEVMPPAKMEVRKENVRGKYKGGQHAAYVRYLDGKYPQFPEAVLEQAIRTYQDQEEILAKEKAGVGAPFGYEPDGDGEYEILRKATAELREKTGIPFDETVVHSYYQTFVLYRTPLSLEALMNLTMGAMYPIYNGGMIQAQLRYFDADRSRSGLPEGVAALISRITDEGVEVTFANTDQDKSHSVILQGGAYGEHALCSVETEGNVVPVRNKWVQLDLAPGCVVTAKIQMKRYANAPSLNQPFAR